MQEMELDDNSLLKRYVEQNSDEAFAAIVSRHINKVYSAALRNTGNPGFAQEITQAVFVILAKEAPSLSKRVILSGWLYQTARLTSLTLLKSEIRRGRREQEARMQTVTNESADETWMQIAPLLDSAMASLPETDRHAVVLRFFDGKSLREVGATLGSTEDSARMRVNRALEKLRRFFARRGVDSTTAIIAGAISGNAAQAAPPALAQSVLTASLAKGSAAGASTLTLVKGALKVMTWTKISTAVMTAVAAILIVTTAGAVILEEQNPNRQRLSDGSILSVSRTAYGETHLIGIDGRTNEWSSPGQPQLIVELKLSGRHAATSFFVKPPFFRNVRGMLYGEHGIEYAQEMLPMQGFEKFGRDYFGQIMTDIIPRDSRFLWLRIDELAGTRPSGKWQTIATFKIPNPAFDTNHDDWAAASTPMTNSVNGMDIILRDVTLTTNSADEHDIWNHRVAVTAEVWKNGIQLTNWAPVFIEAADASGNHVGYFQMHRSLDPRFVWKLDMNFEVTGNFPTENVCTVSMPESRSATVNANVMGAPVTIGWWNGDMVKGEIPTNDTDLALKLINVADEQGIIGAFGGGDGGQFRFDQGYFMGKKNGVMTQMGLPATVTFAVVPNVRTTFYVQPRLLNSQ